jgi:2-isopropylmalate synthase
VSALCNAIDRIVGLEGTLVDYQLRSITEGRDAVGEVFLRIIFDGIEYMGKAASTDIMDATARAYLNAVNKALFTRTQGTALKKGARGVAV